MQQWARRYKELAQRRGAFHRRGRVRAYIFDGINKFGMARAVATMPTLLHISVFLFFIGLVEFLFPIYATVAYATLGSIGVFALAYAALTVLPTFSLNCPYGTPLSGLTWRISQFSVFISLWIILQIQALLVYRKSLSKLRSWASQHKLETNGPKKLWEVLDEHVKIRRQRFSRSLRKSIELGAFRAGSAVVTNALNWTLTALDEYKEIEDFAERVPGFFDSHAVPDATSAVLSLMSHHSNAEPIFGSRLCDLFKTCTPGSSPLDETTRNHRLRVCLKCLWYFGRAYNQPGVSQPLPSYFPKSLIPEIVRLVQTEKDTIVRVMGRCVIAVVVNKVVEDHKSSSIPLDDGVLSCLSTVLDTWDYDLKFLRHQPTAVALANMIPLAFGEVGTLVPDVVPSDLLDVTQQTLGIFAQSLAQDIVQIETDMNLSEVDHSYGKFEHILISHLPEFVNSCMRAPSPLTEDVRTNCLRMSLKRLWFFGRMFNRRGNSTPLPTDIRIAFSNPEMTRRILENKDITLRAVGRCVMALLVNKLVTDINSRVFPVDRAECVQCLSAIFGTEHRVVELLLRNPGAVTLANIIFLVFHEVGTWVTSTVPSDVVDVVRRTLSVLYQALPAQVDAELQLKQTIATFDGSNGNLKCILESYFLGILNTYIQATSTSTEDVPTPTNSLRVCLKYLWYFDRTSNHPGDSVAILSYICVAFSSPDMISRIREQRDPSACSIGQCVGALVVNKLIADLNSRADSISDVELEYISAILDTTNDEVVLLLRHKGVIELTNFLTLANIVDFASARVPSDVLITIQQTLDVLYRALPVESSVKKQLNHVDVLINVSDGISSLNPDMFFHHVYLKYLWYAIRAFNGPGNSAPLPSFISVAFANPEMTLRIREQSSLAFRNTGRCVGALVVNKLVTDLDIRTDLIKNIELACISAILGIEDDEVMLLLRHQGVMELTNIIFLTLAHFVDFASARVPLDALNMVQQTFDVLYRILPAESNIKTQLNQIDTLMNVSGGVSSLTLEMCFHHDCLKNLWRAVRAFVEFENSVPLPSFISVAFADPEMSRRICEQRDPSACSIRLCISALILRKIVTDLNSRADSMRDVELRCISAILNTNRHNVMLWLGHPGAIELAGMLSFALEAIYSLVIDVLSPHALDVVQQTLDFIFEVFPVEGISQQPLDQTISLVHATASKFELIVSSDLQNFLKPCISNTYALGENVRKSGLRICLKSLWCFARLYHRPDAFIPSPFDFTLHSSPEIAHLIRTELDPTLRVIGRCFEALVIDKLVEDTDSLTDKDLSFLSVILGKETHVLWHWLSQPGAIELRNVISVISDEIDTFVAHAIPADVLEMFQQTLTIIGRNLARGRGSADDELYMDQVLYFHNIYSVIVDRGGADWLRYRLEWILSQLPAVENRNNQRRRDLILDEELSVYDVEDSFLQSISDSESTEE